MRRSLLFTPLVAAVLASGTALAKPDMGEAKARMNAIEEALADSDLPLAQQEFAGLEQLAPPGSPPIEYFLGRIAFEKGAYEEAIQRLKAAGVEDEPKSFLRLAKDTQSVVAHHAHQDSAHFIFYYPPGKDAVLAPYALKTLEAQRAALEQDLGYAPAGKVRVEVVNDADELSKVSTLTPQEINTTGTIAICKFSKLMVTSPKAVASGYDWQDTLAHEYTHLVVTQESHNTVPIWLQEGLAKYLETRWRGAAGQSMTPPQRALLAERVKSNKLVPFAKMHPSMAMLPTWEDAYTAFAEVFYAADYVFLKRGAAGLRTIVLAMGHGATDQKAVEEALGEPFSQFERHWMAHLQAQPVPPGAIPPGGDKVVLKSSPEGQRRAKPEEAEKGREIGFRDFAEVTETRARQLAHLGELMRARNRMSAAAEELGKAHAQVGDKYEAISNKYALALLALKRWEEAEKVLLGSLSIHPASAQTEVHLGRIYLARRELPKAQHAYLAALAVDPFDPEIHLALAAVGDGLKDTALSDQERKASAVLTGFSPDRLNTIIRSALPTSGDLSNVHIPPSAAPPASTEKLAPARGLH